MSVRLVLTPYNDPAEGLDWEEQTPLIRERIAKSIKEIVSEDLKFKIHETDHGIGADWPTITLELIGTATGLFFGIPALHKKIREALSEWKLIKDKLGKLIYWIENHEPVASYSIEVAFYDALGYLAKSEDVDNLILVEAKEYVGKTGSTDPTFESALLVYYFLALADNANWLHVFLYDSRLELHFYRKLPLDPSLESTNCV